MKQPRHLDAVLAGVMRREREQRQWRQADLAKRLKWPLSRVTRIENGHQRILMEDMLSLCRVLGMSAAQLLSTADPADLTDLGLHREDSGSAGSERKPEPAGERAPGTRPA